MKEKRSNSILLTFFLWFPCVATAAQVSNNSISQRSALEVDDIPLVSTTDRSTVEWACINKKLTQKCLIYHNDQWFTFTPEKNGRLFLNVTSQQCKKKYGVQVLVLEGNPCETTSYKLKHCESFTDQSDTFITLDSLQAGKTYLVNIDGFLGDICGFEIQLATKPKGLSTKQPSIDTLGVTVKRAKHIVTLEWDTPAEALDSLEYFEAHRQGSEEFKRRCVALMPVQYNALGKIKTMYTVTDTLVKHDLYTYTIVGVYRSGTERRVLDRAQIKFTPEYAHYSDTRKTIEIPLESKRRTDFDLLIMNKLTGEILFKRQCLACITQKLQMDVSSEVARGVQHFRVEIFNTRTKQQWHIDKSFVPGTR